MLQSFPALALCANFLYAYRQAGVLYMVDRDFGLINIQEPADELTLQYLRAATLVYWRDLPLNARDQLLRQSSAITGLKKTTGVQESVMAILRRHGQLEA